LRYLLLYALAAIGSIALEGGLTLGFAPDEASIPGIGASGAISGVLGAYLVLFPFQRVLTWLIPVFFFRIPALGLLGVWFIFQALEGSYSLSHPDVFVGIAFFAHVGGFLAGAVLASLFKPRAWPRMLLPGGHGPTPVRTA
jgi:membrane associated rhomboid family serine protease